MAKPSKNKGQKEVEINENLSDGEEEIGESIVEMEEGREGKILIAFEWLQTNLTYLNWINRVYFRDVTGYECGKVEANHGGLLWKEQTYIDHSNFFQNQKGLDKAFKSLFHSYMTKEILNTFFSITLEMGRVDMPSIADYWHSDDIYSGKDSTTKKDSTIGEQVILALVKDLPKNHPFHLFMDNYYSSTRLFEILYENRGIYATGTIRNNAKNLPRQSIAEKIFDKGKYFVRFKNNLLGFWRIEDSKTFNLISSKVVNQEEMINTRKRRKEPESSLLPTELTWYRSNMGHVDRHNKLVSTYLNRKKSLRWWYPVFIYQFYCAVVNSWVIFNETKEITYLDYIEGLSEQLSAHSIIRSRVPKTPNQPTSSKKWHLPIQKSSKNRCRCNSNCTTSTNTWCSICHVWLMEESLVLLHHILPQLNQNKNRIFIKANWVQPTICVSGRDIRGNGCYSYSTGPGMNQPLFNMYTGQCFGYCPFDAGEPSTPVAEDQFIYIK
ncbi:hypothetical protein DFA_07901 [Cavenderia fasciculata]|uniref:PiggyBac transposable element-derived protein domain-containing protein n=1 Tax=Cavenderia fasciculata TaxID=261658 RepID=F4Q406_CACFS|nr:uncharacterized protein DFA_07901 [Cavenderia fasciculata]EGG16920.1 hypothetical protein DFA_07901 [Cavenderia fasciculata]|eukprot:XP_004355394.1 hypothetical protein DFA_07901 [Cavenderia fasciculata]